MNVQAVDLSQNKEEDFVKVVYKFIENKNKSKLSKHLDSNYLMILLEENLFNFNHKEKP